MIVHLLSEYHGAPGHEYPIEVYADVTDAHEHVHGLTGSKDVHESATEIIYRTAFGGYVIRPMTIVPKGM